MPAPNGQHFTHDPRDRADPTSSQETGDTPAQGPLAEFIEFWVYRDGELVPATGDELEGIRAREREREARWRLKRWRQREHMQQHMARRRRWQAMVDLPRLLGQVSRRWQSAGAKRAHIEGTASDPRSPGEPVSGHD